VPSMHSMDKIAKGRSKEALLLFLSLYQARGEKK